MNAQSFFKPVMLVCTFCIAPLAGAQVVDIESLFSVSGTADDFITGQAVDAAENLYVGGTYCSQTLNFGTLQIESINNGPSAFYQSDIYLAKYAASGEILWAISGGGNYADKLTGLATDSDGNTWFTGYFGSEVFEMDTFSLEKISVTGVDMFAGLIDTGGDLKWLKNFGSEYDTWSRAVCGGDNGEIYVIGEFTGDSMLFDTSKVYLSGTYGFADVFLIRMDDKGNVLKAISVKGDGEDLATAVAYRDGRVVFAMNHYSSVVEFGELEFGNHGMYDAIVGVTDNELNPVIAATLGGGRQDFIYALDIGSEGDIVVTGSFKSDTLYIDDEEFVNASAVDDIKQFDIFLARYNSDLELSYAYTYGDLPNDDGTSVRFNDQGDVILGGSTVSPQLQIGDHTIVHSAGTAGYTDLFMVKIDAAGNGVWSSLFSSELDDENMNIAIDGNTFVVSGNFRGMELTGGEMNVDNSGGDGSYEPFLAIGTFNQSAAEQIASDGLFRIYPNPASEVIYFSSIPEGINRIQVYDLSGRMVKGISSGFEQIKVGDLKPGIYILKACTPGKDYQLLFSK